MKRIAIIGTVGIPAKYGGFETLVEYLTRNISETYEITVYCSSKAYQERLTEYNGCRLEYVNMRANGIQSTVYDIISLIKCTRKADTILILGVSGCIILPLYRLFTKKRLIINIDGLEWKRAKWGKFAKWFLKFSERLAVQYGTEIVSDNKVIQNYVKEEYGKESTLIAYGADHVQSLTLSKITLEKFPFLSAPYALKVCRIEPENNIDMVLEAFEQIPDKTIVMIGNWDKSEYGIKLKSKFSNTQNIYLLDPIYDQTILNEIRSNCDFYVHGHSAGGTNPSLVEAMSLGLPILAYGVDYNRETTENNALYYMNVDDMITIMKTMKPTELTTVGSKMKEIADRRYRWSKISEDYSKLF